MPTERLGSGTPSTLRAVRTGNRPIRGDVTGYVRTNESLAAVGYGWYAAASGLHAEILRAVHSIILAQTHADWELIVVDDGSTDHTLSLLEELDPRIRILRQPTQGGYVARNAGLAASTGRHITLMDSNDEWLPRFLALTLGYLQHPPEAQWVATEFWEDAGDGSPLQRHDLDDIAQIYSPLCSPLRHACTRIAARRIRRLSARLPATHPLGESVHGLVGPQHPLLDDIACAEVLVYRGKIFDAMRWGYLHWLPVSDPPEDGGARPLSLRLPRIDGGTTAAKAVSPVKRRSVRCVGHVPSDRLGQSSVHGVGGLITE